MAKVFFSQFFAERTMNKKKGGGGKKRQSAPGISTQNNNKKGASATGTQKGDAHKKPKAAPPQQNKRSQNHQAKRPLTYPRELPHDHLTTQMRGPTEYSNWIVKNHLLVGAYPLKPHMTKAILQEGVTAFVCLMEDQEFGSHGKHYFEVAKELITENPSEFTQSAESLSYVQCPIPDRDVIDDETMSGLITKVLGLLRRGERVYVHCYGGHGRTGIVASVVLGKVYDLEADKALELCQLYHDSRPDVEGVKASSVPSPQTHQQRAQVQRLLQIATEKGKDK